MPLQYGYQKPLQPPRPPRVGTNALSLAAAGTPSAQNPFGFQAAKNTTGYPDTPLIASAAKSPTVAPPRPVVAPSVNPGAAAALAPVAPTATATPYDINTDPSLQATTAFTGMGDQQAQAAALKAKQQLLLGYGDSGLTQSVLGDTNLAQAAAGNPTSTLANLSQQRDRNTKTLTEGLNQNNLLYSGYRVNQEQQAGQDYQNALANAAAGVNSNLDTISGNLSSALAGNQQTRIQAEQAARDRAVAAAIATGGPGGTGTVSDPGAPASVDQSSGGAAPIPTALSGFTNPGLTSALAAAASNPNAGSSNADAYAGLADKLMALIAPKSGYKTASQLH